MNTKAAIATAKNNPGRALSDLSFQSIIARVRIRTTAQTIVPTQSSVQTEDWHRIAGGRIATIIILTTLYFEMVDGRLPMNSGKIFLTAPMARPGYVETMK